MKITGDTTRVTPRTNRVFGADFGDWSEVQAGDVLASAVIACSPSGPTFGSPTIGANAAGTANAQANFSATGFSARKTYTVDVTPTTVSGKVLSPSRIYFVSGP